MSTPDRHEKIRIIFDGLAQAGVEFVDDLTGDQARAILAALGDWDGDGPEERDPENDEYDTDGPDAKEEILACWSDACVMTGADRSLIYRTEPILYFALEQLKKLPPDIIARILRGEQVEGMAGLEVSPDPGGDRLKGAYGVATRALRAP